MGNGGNRRGTCFVILGRHPQSLLMRASGAGAIEVLAAFPGQLLIVLTTHAAVACQLAALQPLLLWIREGLVLATVSTGGFPNERRK